MRAYCAEGHTAVEVAEKFGASRDHAKKICRGVDRGNPYRPYRNQYTNGSFDRISNVKQWIKKCNSDMEYVGGFKDFDSPVRIRCLKCGSVFDRSMITIRKCHKTTCETCRVLEAEVAKEEHAQEVLKRKRERHEAAVEAAALRAVAKKESKIHNCPVCGTITSRRKYCSPECCRKANGAYNAERSKVHEIRRRTRTRNQIVDRDISLQKLFERDNGICWICGMVCDYSDKESNGNTIVAGNLYPSIDHIVPLSQGGEHSWKNVKLAHRICNTVRFYSPPRFGIF